MKNPIKYMYGDENIAYKKLQKKIKKPKINVGKF